MKKLFREVTGSGYISSAVLVKSTGFSVAGREEAMLKSVGDESLYVLVKWKVEV